jgi:hypothetical protein
MSKGMSRIGAACGLVAGLAALAVVIVWSALTRMGDALRRR